MKYIILAAGKGTRVLPLTLNTPKVLLPLNNKITLLDYQLNQLIKTKNCQEIIVIAGYKIEMIRQKCSEYSGQIKIRIFFNPKYQINNPLFSLETVFDIIQKNNFVIMNEDTIFLKNIFNSLPNNEQIQLVVSNKHLVEKHDMKILKKNNLLIRVDKNLTHHNGISTGLAVIQGKKNREMLIKAVQSLIKKCGDSPHFWHDVFNQLIQKHIPINTIEIPTRDWAEIDTVGDLSSARKLIACYDSNA